VRALVNARILEDGGFTSGRVVLVDGARIAAIVAEGDARMAGAERIDLAGGRLVPGFVDCQVNGGGGVLFNDDPSVESIRAIGAAHRPFGTTAFLPTLISDDFSVIARAIRAVRDAIQAGVPGVVGIHIEGPFINEARRGVHDAAKIRDLDARDVALLSSLGPNAPDTPLAKAQRAALFSRRPPQAPIALVRNGKEFKISGDQSEKVGGSYSFQVGQAVDEKIGTKHATEAGQEIHLKAGMKVIIEAGMQVSLKGPGGFVDIGPTGVTIQGTMVLINSGGSAGSGSGASPKDPKDPKDPDQADDGSKFGKM